MGAFIFDAPATVGILTAEQKAEIMKERA